MIQSNIQSNPYIFYPTNYLYIYVFKIILAI